MVGPRLKLGRVLGRPITSKVQSTKPKSVAEAVAFRLSYNCARFESRVDFILQCLHVDLAVM
jgi:hypothetical protein